MAAQKDTIYIDVDDEITSIVDKVNASSSKIVALVLPKRAAVLQSIVNMKLLKRTADDAGKRIVLITSEAGLLPLAGAVGIYVAKNLQSKPEIPEPPEGPTGGDDVLEAEEAPAEPELDKNAPVGELAAPEKMSDDELFESAATAPAAMPKAAARKKQKAPKVKKEGKNKIPNFDRFRKKVFIGVTGVIALLALVYAAFFVLPKATIAIQTETSGVNSSIDFVASPTTQDANIDGGVIPAKMAESQKTETQSVAATGQKDLGTKASGSVTLSIPCSAVSGSPPTIPAGTGVSTSDLTFITQSSTSLTTPSFSGGCKFTGSTNVTAQNNGDQYNINSGRSFTVAGYSSVTGTNGSGFSGGSSKIAKVISQQDIDNAKQKLSDVTQEVKAELQKELEDKQYYAILDTFVTKSESIKPSNEVGQEANEVTITAERVFTMTGVKRDDLRALVEHEVKDETESRSLRVQDDGIDQATFRLGDRKDDGTTNITMQVQIALGPNINEEQLKKDIAGKKKGDVENKVKSFDGVESVEVTFSPFWVSMAPRSIDKITIEFKEANN